MLAMLTPEAQIYAERDWLTTHYQPGGKVGFLRFRFRFYRFFSSNVLDELNMFFGTINEHEM